MQHGDRSVLGLLPAWLRRVMGYGVAVLVLVAVLWVVTLVLSRVIVVTFAAVGALLLAALMAPTARLLRRWHLPAWLASLLSVFLVLGVLAAAVFLVVNRALAQVEDLQQTVADGIRRLEDALIDSPLPVSGERVERAEEQMLEFVQGALPSPTVGATIVVELLVGLVLAIFLMFFLLYDGRRMWSWFVAWTPSSRRDEVDGSGQVAWLTLERYAQGTVIVALADSIGIGIGMFALGVPLASSLTLIVFVGAFVPIVGATISGVLAVGVTLVLLGPVEALILLGVVLLVQQLEGNLVQPLVMGRVLSLHPVVIVVTVTIATTVAGVLGALASVPLVAVTYRVVEYLSGRREPDELTGDDDDGPDDGPDDISGSTGDADAPRPDSSAESALS